MSGDPSASPSQVLETKVVILGHTGVGKTSMLNQFVRGSFTGQSTATIGAAFMKKTVPYNGWQIILQIWDTAGQERFRSMAPMYYRGAHAAVLVFDITSADTLDKVGGWADELTGHSHDDSMVLVLAANKADLKSQVADESDPAAHGDAQSIYPSSLQQSAKDYANSIHAAYFETSAKTGEGIEALFTHVASTLLANHLDKQARMGSSHDHDDDDDDESDDDRGSSRRGRKVNVQKRNSDSGGRGGCC